MSAHTPGTWAVAMDARPQFGDVFIDAYDEAGRKTRVAEVFGCETEHAATEAESLANARLFSAAPDLLELVQEAADDPDRCDCGDNVDAWPVGDGATEGTFSGPCFHCRARSAIAKAEGGSA